MQACAHHRWSAPIRFLRHSLIVSAGPPFVASTEFVSGADGRGLQAALVYVNTPMVQDVLADNEWAAALTDADRRGLTPLFWTHVAPYGEVGLDMSSRLALGATGRETAVRL